MKPWRLAVMGEAEPEAVDAVEQILVRHFSPAVRRIRLPEPDFAYDAGRRQYGSVAVLQELLVRRPADAGKLLGVVGKDLFIPMLTFVFGQAQLDGSAGVISLARLRPEFYGMPPDSRLLQGRAAKEALHEGGHLMGLVHCEDRRCAMALATNIRQLDAKSPGLCGACTALLAGRRAAAEGTRS